jgi:phosphomannomutase
MAAKFGTSGLRGLVGELTDGTAAAHARAFARHLKQARMARPGTPLFIGRDRRSSSPDIAAQCAAALFDEGLEPVDCGVLPTPALALYAMGQNAGALMITGSHIPDDRNGVKFYRPDGEIDKTDEAAISQLAPHCVGLASPEGKLMRDRSSEASAAFVERYRGFAPDGLLSGLRIGLYEHSSAANETLAAILEAEGVEIIRFGSSPVFIPVDTEAVSEETRTLASGWVRSGGLDGLVSTDGDGDRPMVVDESGEVVRGDALGLMVARYLGADAVVTPVTSNSGIESHCSAEVSRTRVGSPFVIAGMAEALGRSKRCVIGFEANGGVLTGNPISSGSAELAALPTRDSVLPILCAFAAARQAGQPLSAHVAALSLPVAASDRIENFPTEQSQALVARLSQDETARQDFFEPFGKVAHVDLTDGLRVVFESGNILHLRPSGNAPEMRVYSEAATEALARDIIATAIARIRLAAHP